MEMLQLKIMTHLAETLSFSTTAAMLHITQPAVTYHLKKLEDELGVVLFERSTHSTVLTEAGREFYQYAADICSTAMHAEQRIRTLKSGKKEAVHIGASYSFSPLIPVLLNHVLRDNPHAQYDVTIMNDPELISSVSVQECDVYIGAYDLFSNNKHYKLIDRGPAFLKLFLPAKMAAEFNMNDWSSLNDVPYLSFPLKNTFSVHQVESIMENHHYYPSNIFHLNSSDIILDLIADGSGFTIFDSIFELECGKDRIVTLSLPDQEAEYRTCAAIRSGKQSPLIDYITGLIMQESLYRGIKNS